MNHHRFIEISFCAADAFTIVENMCVLQFFGHKKTHQKMRRKMSESGEKKVGKCSELENKLGYCCFIISIYDC